MLILATYVSLVQNCMLIPKKYGALFLDQLKVIFRPLEVMTHEFHLFIYLNTTSRVAHQNDRNCLGNIIRFENMK